MKLGIVGVSGLVGDNILTSLNLLNIDPEELYLFGYSSTGGKRLFNDKEYEILQFNNDYLNKLDYIILAVENDVAKEIIDYHKNNNCSSIIIDNSSEYRLCNDVPLVIPEVNGDLLNGNSKIIANPNCSTTMLVMLLKPLLQLSEIKKVVVSTYQAASGAGKKGYDELMEQTYNYGLGQDITMNFWKKQYIFNVFSHNSKIDPESKYNMEELKMVKETCKILNRNMRINPTCIRVPTLRSHCLSVNVEFYEEQKLDKIMEVLEKFPGIKILNNEEKNEFPEPLLTSKKTDIYVGRIRPETGIDYVDNTSWSFFVSGDQLLKGAAYNSVQILKQVINLHHLSKLPEVAK